MKDRIFTPNLIVFCLNTFMIVLLLFSYYSMPYIVYYPLLSICMYFNFTPFHESSHNLIARGKYKYLNNIVGYTSNFIYTSVFPVWKFIHKQHHLYTNNKLLDPDKFYNNLSDILRWGWFLDYIYLTYYMKHFIKRPVKEQVECIATIYLYLMFFYQFIKIYSFQTFFLQFYLPQRTALMMSSFILDYQSHHNCDDYTLVKNKSKITNKIIGVNYPYDYPVITKNYHTVSGLS